ncbi:MAG: hypothetical protein ACI4MJ_03040 [Aristaeellaceae bacterium]
MNDEIVYVKDNGYCRFLQEQIARAAGKIIHAPEKGRQPPMALFIRAKFPRLGARIVPGCLRILSLRAILLISHCERRRYHADHLHHR